MSSRHTDRDQVRMLVFGGDDYSISAVAGRFDIRYPIQCTQSLAASLLSVGFAGGEEEP